MAMIRYRLDDLGWYQFEWLIQSLLKAEVSSALESWGGRGDHGRDAYYADSLPFPIKHMPSSGPFLFQVKFIENGNAAGAKPDNLLISAVKKEAATIADRLQTATSVFCWIPPTHYSLYTNVALTPEMRTKIAHVINEVLPLAAVHSFGGGDVCDLLDKHEGLRRSFPQLLGLRDLEELLLAATNKESIERSRRAIEAARDVCAVFVPTTAYERTWRVLRKHHFVVLEGPPEMGKTAIAWIVALAQVAAGWDAIVCDDPTDFFSRIESTRTQVFVADDAFGRTEYDPARGLKWERNLAPILRSVDPKHWLIWTSRKHILERAKRAMDTQIPSKKFPDPAALLVDASLLSDEEKALMLYRHSRNAGLHENARNVVRQHARTIVKDPNFTPERIRRFVKEALPELSGDNPREKLQSHIKEAIRNPTDRMRKSFLALPPSHKWFLIALLEAGGDDIKDVTAAYEEHCPLEDRQPTKDVFEELRESFVKVGDGVDGTHPSYRDLVIEELGKDESLKAAFFKKISLAGIKLAVSDTGGTLGERSLPLMSSSDSWAQLQERCIDHVSTASQSQVAELLLTLSSAAEEAHPDAKELLEVLEAVCRAVYEQWKAKKTPLSTVQLKIYQGATVLLNPLPPVPDLLPSWIKIDASLQKELESPRFSLVMETRALEEWIDFADTVKQLEPRFLKQVGFPDEMTGRIAEVLHTLDNDLDELDTFGDYDELTAQVQHLDELGGILLTLANLAPDHCGEIETLRNRIMRLEARSAEAAEEVRPPDPDIEDFKQRTSDFDIEGLFGDL